MYLNLHRRTSISKRKLHAEVLQKAKRTLNYVSFLLVKFCNTYKIT